MFSCHLLYGMSADGEKCVCQVGDDQSNSPCRLALKNAGSFVRFITKFANGGADTRGRTRADKFPTIDDTGDGHTSHTTFAGHICDGGIARRFSWHEVPLVQPKKND